MILRKFRTKAGASRALAKAIAQAVAQNPHLVLGLPTGRTPIPLYHALVALYRAGTIDLSQVTTFNLDEFVGFAPSDPRSYHAYMCRHLFEHVNLAERRTHVLSGNAPDPDAECARFERTIARSGGIDLMILGLGRNGHIGFNEPDDGLIADTHRTRLRRSTRRANAFLFGDRLSAVPREGLSMGIGTILRARKIVLFVTGQSKARALARAIRGRVTPRLPASFLQLHRDVEVWLDGDAASLMSSN